MKEKADAWQMELTKITWEYEKIFEAFDLTSLNLKPQPGKWSPLEIVHHLIKVNISYFAIFEIIIAGKYKAPLLGKLPFYSKKMGELILASMNKPTKVETFQCWQPTEKMHNNDLKREFMKTQDSLSNYMLQLEPYLGKNINIPSPANKWVMYSLDQAIEIILAHEERHLTQIKNQLIPQ